MAVEIKPPSSFHTLEEAREQINALNQQALLKPSPPSTLLLVLMWLLGFMSFAGMMGAALSVRQTPAGYCANAVNLWLMHAAYLTLALCVGVVAVWLRKRETVA